MLVLYTYKLNKIMDTHTELKLISLTLVHPSSQLSPRGREGGREHVSYSHHSLVKLMYIQHMYRLQKYAVPTLLSDQSVSNLGVWWLLAKFAKFK